jgi:hypothetical protein
VAFVGLTSFTLLGLAVTSCDFGPALYDVARVLLLEPLELFGGRLPVEHDLIGPFGAHRYRGEGGAQLL